MHHHALGGWVDGDKVSVRPHPREAFKVGAFVLGTVLVVQKVHGHGREGLAAHELALLSLYRLACSKRQTV